jgi:formylglycine-generating enzyme required for sulfatase activity
VLEHELMHHETLLYLLQELPFEDKVRASWWSAPVVGGDASELPAVRVPAGQVRLGADFDSIPFGWDNEFPARSERVEAFELDALPVTLARFAEFVSAGGYRDERCWSPRGWSWAQKHGLAQPKDWVRRGKRWHVRAMFDELPLDEVAAWPACVSWAEADAFARWSGARLPSEAELFRAAYGDDERAFPWGSSAAGLEERGNFGLRGHSPAPVGLWPASAGWSGAQELVGNGWEWTATLFERHAGFESWIRVYPGYSRDFFDGAHYAMFGASWATDDTLVRRSFRNWFRYNYPYPFTKLRLARDA